MELLTAPAGYMPKCATRHDESRKTMYQYFSGNRVKFVVDNSTLRAEAIVDNRCIASWHDITLRQWSDILYTLETNFADKILTEQGY